MTKKLLLLALLNSFAMYSQIIFNDDFSSYSSGQPLSGQGSWTNNSSLNGGLGSCSGFGCVSSSIVNTSISYPNYGSASKSLSISSNQVAVGTVFTSVSSGSLYLSFVVNFSSAVNEAIPINPHNCTFGYLPSLKYNLAVSSTSALSNPNFVSSVAICTCKRQLIFF